MTDEWEDESEVEESEAPGAMPDGATAVPLDCGWLLLPNGVRAFCEAHGADALLATHEGAVYLSRQGRWLEMPEGPESAPTPIGSRRVQ